MKKTQNHCRNSSRHFRAVLGVLGRHSQSGRCTRGSGRKRCVSSVCAAGTANCAKQQHRHNRACNGIGNDPRCRFCCFSGTGNANGRSDINTGRRSNRGTACGHSGACTRRRTNRKVIRGRNATTARRYGLCPRLRLASK